MTTEHLSFDEASEDQRREAYDAVVDYVGKRMDESGVDDRWQRLRWAVAAVERPPAPRYTVEWRVPVRDEMVLTDESDPARVGRWVDGHRTWVVVDGGGLYD